MQAYHNGITKSDFIREIKLHMDADNFIKGVYSVGEDYIKGKGCAVGCSIKSINKIKDTCIDNADHKAYAESLGIPLWLAKMEDRIFEGLPLEESKLWPLRFSIAINVGADLSPILNNVLIFIVKSTLKYFDNVEYKNIKKIIDDLIVQLQAPNPDKEKLNKIGDAAYAASAAAYATAASAAYAAAYAADDAAAYAAGGAAAAAYAAAADDAADAADDAADADAADDAADAAFAAAAGGATEREKFYIDLSNELIRLIEEVK